MIIKSIDVYMNNNLYGVIVIFVCRIYVFKNFIFIKLIDFERKKMCFVYGKKFYFKLIMYIYIINVILIW